MPSSERTPEWYRARNKVFNFFLGKAKEQGIDVTDEKVRRNLLALANGFLDGVQSGRRSQG